MLSRRLATTVVVSIAALAAGCSDAGLSSENFSKVRNGMTPSEVESLLGSPNSETSVGGVTTMGWSGSAGDAVVVFENGKVTAKRSEGL